VELITPHRTTNYHENRKGGQGQVWAVAPLIIIFNSERMSVLRFLFRRVYPATERRNFISADSIFFSSDRFIVQFSLA
jgi:hypothetical protein